MKFPVKTHLFDIVIPTKNSVETLPSCLEGLLQSDVPVNRIIVVDKSTDRTPEVARRFGCEVIRSEANYSQALRIGAQNANTDYILILDSDVVINQKFYSKLRKRLGNFFVVKGVHRHQLEWKELSNWLLDYSKQQIGYLEAAFVHRITFLRLTKDWEDGHLDAGGDKWLYKTCERLDVPVFFDPSVVSVHLTENFRRFFGQARWYGRSARRSKLENFATVVAGFLRSPLGGLRLILQYGSLKLLPFYVTLKLYVLWGYIRER